MQVVAIDNFVKNYLFSIISVDSLIDQLVEISVVIRTPEVGNTTVVVVSEVGGTAGAHRANKVVPLLGPEISETIHQ